jgi:SAM-dependent methyltransferase
MLAFACETIQSRPDLSGVTTLVQSSIEDFETNEKFDFIYSIGTLGEFCEFNTPVMKSMLSSLKPGGLLFFTIVDAKASASHKYSHTDRMLNAVLKRVLPFKYRFKFSPQNLVLSDWENLFLTREQVEQVIESAGMPIRYEITQSKDNVHVHHICKVWLQDKLRMLLGFFYLSAETFGEFLAPELLAL